jgi:cytochrome c556
MMKAARCHSALAVAILLLAAGGSTIAQKSRYPIYTADHLNDAMMTVGLAFELAQAAVAKNDFENAKDYLIRARDWLAPTITFWRDRKADAAVAMLRDTLAKLDALDAAMSAESVDGPEAARRAKAAAAACEACHSKYREQDPTTKAYRLKPGLDRIPQ